MEHPAQPLIGHSERAGHANQHTMSLLERRSTNLAACQHAWANRDGSQTMRMYGHLQTGGELKQFCCHQLTQAWSHAVALE